MNSIDKSEWQKVTFGDVCLNINLTEKNPISNGLDRFIGLEHIEPGNLHISSWGNVSDGTTFTKRFKKGDVLFGKRRAYQKKVALAEIDGICSGDILVFEAIKQMIDPRLLPFVCMSDRFFEFAVKTSAGSLSPRTKFQDLTKFEFLIPPKEKQAKLAELLWAADEMIQNGTKLMDSLTLLKSALSHQFFTKNPNLKMVKICDLGFVFTGTTPPTKIHDYWDGTIPFITPAEITDTLEPNNTTRYVTEAGLLKSREVSIGDILVVCIGSTIGKVTIARERCVTNQQINIIRPNDSVTSLFLYFNLLWHKSMIISKAGTTAVPIINKGFFEKIELPLSLLSKENNQLGNQLAIIEKTIATVASKIRTERLLFSILINKIFNDV